MSATAPPTPLSIEPLHERHDRAIFASGADELDRYLHIQAGQDAKRSVAAPFVLLENGKTIVGYYTLSAYGIHLTDLPAEILRRLPKCPLVPVTLLGRLAISRDRQGQKLGQLMLMDALLRSLKTTREVGSIGVVADAYDGRAEAFYLHHEFTPLPGQTRKLFLAMATTKKLFSEQYRNARRAAIPRASASICPRGPAQNSRIACCSPSSRKARVGPTNCTDLISLLRYRAKRTRQLSLFLPSRQSPHWRAAVWGLGEVGRVRKLLYVPFCAYIMAQPSSVLSLKLV